MLTQVQIHKRMLAVMKAMVTVTKELLPHIPPRMIELCGQMVKVRHLSVHEGDEIEVDYDVRWEGCRGHNFQPDEGDAIVENVIYTDPHTGEEIDLTDLVEIEIDYQEADEARRDAYEAHADYVYDCWKERDL